MRHGAWIVPSALVGLVVASANQACRDPVVFPDDPPLVVGATVDLTRQKDFGAGSQRVLRVAEQQLNAVGGILGRRVVLDIRDDAGDDSVIGTIAADFIDRGAAGLIGPSTTHALEAIHESFKEARIPILTPFATAPTVPLLQQGRDRYLFRTSCAVEYQARAIARFALGQSFAPPGTTAPIPGPDAGSSSDAGADASDADSDAGASDGDEPPAYAPCKKMVVLYAEDAPGQGSATIDSLRAEYTKFGGKLEERVIQSGAATYSADVAAVVKAARAGEVDCQTLLMFPADGGKYMREFRRVAEDDASLSPTRFMSFGFIRFYQQGFIEAARVDAKNASELSRAEGVLGAACNQQRTTSPEWTRFQTLYDSHYPPVGATNLPSPIPQIYDSVIVLALAVERAGGLEDREAVRDALYEVSSPPGQAYGPSELAEALDAVRNGRDIDYTGASGTFDIDERGDTSLEVIMWRVEDNGFVTLPGLRSDDLQR